ncbi:MAG: hypothetical protein ACD_19C00153G0001 [uncultured bacterium]|nr:MAG: hypothetical protein ACD_19C00153G0001 [uncultured bacterium]
MSKKMGIIRGHRFHGDPNRFQVLADYIAEKYKGRVEAIADVAGGQGMLTKILHKKYNFDAEVIDTREYVLRGVKFRRAEYKTEMADYYDLVIGLHPDEATKAVAESALVRPTIIIPCCNFWDRKRKLGRDALLEEIGQYFKQNSIKFKKVKFDFEGPKNVGLVSEPSIGENKSYRSCQR